MRTKMKFGLLLPHFCEHASAANCLEGAKRAEAYGFDSAWVRDHLVFEPHGIEGSDNTHIEGLLLAAIAAVTKDILVGTSMAICHRHPIHLAQLFAGLSAISQGRIIMGMGLGGFSHEFAAAGYPTGLEARAYEEAGADHVVFDLRFRYADWLAQIDLLGKEVLPMLRD